MKNYVFPLLWILWGLFLFMVVTNSNRIEYAFDQFIGAVKTDCTFQMYENDREQCIWDSLKD